MKKQLYEKLNSVFSGEYVGEKDDVKRLQTVSDSGKVHIGAISAFRTSIERGFAGIKKAKEFFGSDISFTNESDFLDKYVMPLGEKYSRKLNFERNNMLGNMLRSWKKVSFRAVTGEYKETASDSVDQERSFLVISRPGVKWDEFRDVLIGLGVLFGQDSVFLKEAGKSSVLVHTNYSEVEVDSDGGTLVDNGKYELYVSDVGFIGTDSPFPKFTEFFNRVDSAIKDTVSAYSIFDKYGKRLDMPDRASKMSDKTKVFTGDVSETENFDTAYCVGHWNMFVESGGKFQTIFERYRYEEALKYINFCETWNK